MRIKRATSTSGLETRFVVVFVVCLGLGLLTAGGLSYRVESDHARHELETTALLVLETAAALRGYTRGEVAPLFPRDRLAEASVPAYAVERVLTRLGERLPDFTYRQVALEPVHVRNRATHREVSIIRRFIEDPGLEDVSGVFSEPAPARYYLARPLYAPADGCAACHGEFAAATAREEAPHHSARDLQWKTGDLLGTEIVEIPLSTAWKTSVSSMVITTAGLACVFLVTGVVFLMIFRRAVSVPLETLSREAEQLSLAPLAEEHALTPQDGPFARLALALQRLRASIRYSVEGDGPNEPKP